MYENMVDVLIYLYEHYMDGDTRPPSDQGELEDELVQAGFTPSEIEQALRWLDELAEGVEVCQSQEDRSGSIRVYTDDESLKLDVDARGLLLFLEQTGILDPVSRELVIDRLLAIEHPAVTLDEVKWVVLLVLMSRPGREDAFSRMEDLVYNDQPFYLH
jgi:Smg protein